MHMGHYSGVKLTELCEVRVPTYRRPRLLRRALTSILQQTYGGWRCVVFDDCPDGSARAIVEDLNDGRIGYLQNHPALGATGNIDRSFTGHAIVGGRYALVLEDDNYLLPNHIETAINILKKNNVRVALCNQFCEQVDLPGEPGRISNDKTLDWMYDEGRFDPTELLPVLLFSQGFSNGAAFWRTDCVSDFQIGAVTRRPGIQESLRLLQLKEPVYVSLEPTAVWRSNDPRESYVSAERATIGSWQSARLRLDQFMEGTEKISYRRAAIERVGIGGVLDYAKTSNKGRAAEIERSLLLCGYNVNFTKRGRTDQLWLRAVGRAARSVAPTILARASRRWARRDGHQFG
jgi:glycosyltransferase involved in cell wall biosynthesis